MKQNSKKKKKKTHTISQTNKMKEENEIMK